jgi:nucleotidyltransferase substrate binding protein (TIGR01987 family)
MIIQDVNISPLIKAFKKFKEFKHIVSHSEPSPELEVKKAGLIQGFEFCYERCWKTMKKLLEKDGKQPLSTKDIFRLSAAAGFIKNPEVWFVFLDKRNLTPHTYEEDEAELVIEILDQFEEEVKDFIQRIGGSNALN